jgi:RimJ/RimL family protein N-acetyltransferase
MAIFLCRQRLAEPKDLPAIMLIIGQAQNALRVLGIDQWQNGYPGESVLASDIAAGQCYVSVENDEVMGLVVITFKPEACYKLITDGQWLTSGESYAVLHRMAVHDAVKRSGVAHEMAQLAEKLCQGRGVKAIRADTHCGNLPMQRFLQKNGFTYCGLVDLGRNYPGDSIRMAFEKVITTMP